MPKSDDANPSINTPYGKKWWALIKEGLDVIEATPIFIVVHWNEHDLDCKTDDRGRPIIHTKTDLWGPFAKDAEADKALADHRQKSRELRGYNFSYTPLKMARGVPQVYQLPRDEGNYHPYHVHYVSKTRGTRGFLINARSDGVWINRDNVGQYARPEDIQVGDTIHIPRAEGREEFGVVEKVEKKPLFWNDPA